MPDFETLER